MSSEAHSRHGRPGDRPAVVEPFWALVLVIWVVLLWLLPDPRPLAAPEWAVERVQAWVDLSGPAARALVTVVFRAAGIAALGLFLGLALSRLPLRQAALFAWSGLRCLPSWARG